MKAAIYARFSTDRQDDSSIADQVRICEAHAARHGFKIVERFDDQGISGAAIGNRPGVQAMLEAARGRRFDVVLVSDLSRLSRSQGDLPRLIERLQLGGVRVVGVQDGYDSSRKGHKLQAGLAGIIGEAFRDMVKERTGSALRMRAEQGYHAGGAVFGYTVVPDGRFRRKQIDPDQAVIVREIFDRYARGASMLEIAQDLNARRVPAPGAAWKRAIRRHDGKWLVSALHAILHNELYIGRLIYGRRVFQKDPDTGARIARAVPPAEWTTRDMPELAIIERPVWDRVQARLGSNVGAGRSTAKPVYLLSGLLVCSECGSKLVVMGGSQRRYVCSSYHHGGVTACTNGLTVARALAEEVIVGAVLPRLQPDVVDQVVVRVREELGAQRRAAPAKRSSPALAEANRRIADLERLVSLGTLSAAEALGGLERARQARAAALREVQAGDDAKTVEETFRGWAGRLRQALDGADVSQAREALRQVVGTIQVRPYIERTTRGALRPEETLDGEGIEAGESVERYLVARFSRCTEELPLHPVLTAEWMRQTGISFGSGGRI
ncbi:MAG TPA: recombinase family protein [Steroidobacteraceae bacterium]|nr:recombinase family protein [Steroidobacteraceae bacterium]